MTLETRRIGQLEVSEIGLGCNNFGWRMDESSTREVVAAALDHGINFFDTADVYGGVVDGVMAGGESERQLGQALQGRRDEALVATKFGSQMGADPSHGGASPRWIREAVDGSLARLGVEHIDLYQIHRPDPAVGIDETLGALTELVEVGKVREIGCSNFSADMLREAAKVAERDGVRMFASVQNHYSLAWRNPEKEDLAACQELGIAFIPYFPLASGLLTGKYRFGEDPPEDARLSGGGVRESVFLNDEMLKLAGKLEKWAAGQDRSLLQLAFAWLLAQPHVSSVIAGATSVAQIEANAASSGWELSASDLAELDAINPFVERSRPS